jgi:hypothetical protein
MLFLIAILFSVTFLFISTRDANAIIAIVPVILIPVVSIVVWIIGAITAPVITLSAIYFKMKKRSTVLGIFVGIGILLLLGIVITLIFKLVNPQRPIY